MLINYTCKNYKSIKDKIIFSMQATPDSSLPHHLVDKEFTEKQLDEDILKFACIYGNNGSGKTSFINSLVSLCELITDNDVLMPYEKLVQIPHKLSSANDPTEYSVLLEKKGTKYLYELSYNEEKVFYESLFFWPNGRRAEIFERTGNTIHASNSFKFIEVVCQDKCAPNKILLQLSAKEIPNSVVADVYDFFNSDLVFYNKNEKDWLTYTAESIQNNQVVKDIVIDTLTDNGIPVKDIFARVDKMPIPEYEIPPSLPESYKKVLRAKKKTVPVIKLIYDNFEVSIEEESEGVQKLVQMTGPLVNIIIDDKILLWDEIENFLHPKVVHHLLDLFTVQNSRKAQLITTTHSLDFIDNKILRRDQIWMTSNNSPERCTCLYRLSDLKGVRKDENLRGNYLRGVYGKDGNME